MSNITRFETETGIEILIDTTTGEAFASISGYARMAGLTKQAISKRMQGVNQNEVKTAEIHTPGGVQGVNLIPAKLVYRWLRKDNPDLADEMGEVGATVFLHKLAGYQVTSTAVTQPPQLTTQSEISNSDLDLLRACLKSVNPALVDGFLLNRIGVHKPHLVADIKEAHKVLAAITTIPDVLMTPTLLGKELDISAVKVNRLLVAAGYQIKNEKKSKGSPDYVPTELGKQYSELTMATGSGTDNTTYQHLKWHRNILDVLGDLV